MSPRRMRSSSTTASSRPSLQLAEPDAQLLAALRRARLAHEDDVRGDPERLDGERGAGEDEEAEGAVVEVEKELPAGDVNAGEAVRHPEADVERGGDVDERDDPRDDEDAEEGELDADVVRVARDEAQRRGNAGAVVELHRADGDAAEEDDDERSDEGDERAVEEYFGERGGEDVARQSDERHAQRAHARPDAALHGDAARARPDGAAPQRDDEGEEGPIRERAEGAAVVRGLAADFDEALG